MNSSQTKSDRRFVELLQKWLAGDFRRADELDLHALTRSTDDEFRREAFEGFAEQSEAVGEAEMSAMRHRFQKKYRPARTRPLPLVWATAAAAMFVLLAGSVWLFKNFQEKTNHENLAIETTQLPENQPLATTSEAQKPVEIRPENQLGGSENFQKSAAGKSSAPIFSKKEESSTLVFSEPKKDEAVAPDDLSRDELDAQKSMVLEEKQAEKESPKTEAAAPPPAAADAKIQGVQTAETPSKPSGAFGKAAEKPAAAQKRAAAPQIAADDADKLAEKQVKNKAETFYPEPEIGYAAYRDYLKLNLKMPEQAKLQGLKGDVKLKFYVDSAGQPIQILVYQSLGAGCDSEAVRLVQSGPKWTIGHGEVLLSIHFE